MQNNDESPEDVKIGGYNGGGVPSNEGRQGLLGKALPIVISIILAVVAVNYLLLPSLVSKADFTTNIQRIDNGITDLKVSVATLNGLTTQIADLSNSIGTVSSEVAGLRGSIAGYATQGSVSTIQTSLATIQADLNVVKTSMADIPALKTQVTALQTSLDALKTQVTALDARVVKLETKTTTTSGGGITTGDITVVSSILDEGTVNTDNSTQSQIKLVIQNTTSTDLEDIIISVLVIIDDSSSIRPTLGVSGWGSWSIKSWESGDLEIRSKVGYILKAGEKKNVYLNLISWGDIVNTLTGERDITYTDVSGSDIEVRSYSVK